MTRLLLALSASLLVAVVPFAASAQDANGIVFGEPVTFTSGSLTTVGVLVTNTSDQVMSFTAKATYKTGDSIAATAVGVVNDLMPGQQRAASLLASEAIPSSADSVRLDVDTMVIRQASTAGASAAAAITFGRPAVRSLGALTTVDVEVTNGDSAPHSFTVQMAALSGDALVGIASGAVNDLAAGQTKTASLLTTGSVRSGATFLLAVDTVVS